MVKKGLLKAHIVIFKSRLELLPMGKCAADVKPSRGNAARVALGFEGDYCCEGQPRMHPIQIIPVDDDSAQSF